MEIIQRSWHADDDDVHLANPAVICGRTEAALLGQLDFRAGNPDNV